MNIKELKESMKAANEQIDTEELKMAGIEIEEETNTFSDYWAGSASQSYVNSIKRNDVRTVIIGE